MADEGHEFSRGLFYYAQYPVFTARIQDCKILVDPPTPEVRLSFNK